MPHLAFIRKAIRLRKSLIQKGLSQRNELEMLEALKHLDALLDANHYTQDQAAAMFKRKSEMILKILPGKECKSHEKILETFNNLMK